VILADGMSLKEAVEAARGRLAEAGVEAPRRDARLLTCSLLGGGPELLLADPDRPLSREETRVLCEALERRVRREPISRILGWREFWSLEFLLTEETLDPRPDSETLVEAVLAWVGPQRDQVFRILDFGCGSGCLLLALLSELPAARGLGIDIAPGAVAASTRNARHLGLAGRSDFQTGSWSAGPAGSADGPWYPGPWDIVISNPPYIPSGEIAGLAPEVADYDPTAALDGGGDGLAAYRSLIPQVAAVVSEAGLFALEVGVGQAGAVSTLLQEVDFPTIWSLRDLSGVERCVLATRAHKRRTIQPKSITTR